MIRRVCAVLLFPRPAKLGTRRVRASTPARWAQGITCAAGSSKLVKV